MERIERLYNTLVKEGLVEAYLEWNDKEYILKDKKFLIKDLKKSVSTEKLITSVIDEKSQARLFENEKQDWQVAQNTNTVRSYNQYLEKYPLGMFLDQARAGIKLLDADQDAWEDAAGANTLKSYSTYLSKYTDGLFVDQAKKRIKKLEEKNLQVEKREKSKKPEDIPKKRAKTVPRKPEPKESTRPVFYKAGVKRKVVFGLVFAVVFVVAVTFIIMTFGEKKSTPEDNMIADVGSDGSVQKATEGIANQVETRKDPEESENVTAKETDPVKNDGLPQKADKKKQEQKSKKGEKNKATIISPKKEPVNKVEPPDQEIKKKTELREEKNIKMYKEYLNSARIYFRGGVLDQALESVNKARKINESDELDKLENEIRQKLEAQEREKAIRTIRLVDVQQSLSQNYYTSIKHLDIVDINPPNKIGGQVFVKLKISDEGRVSIQSFNSSRLNIDPGDQKGYIESLIKKRLSSIRLTPPRDKAGQTVRVDNWPVTFEVGKFRNKIVLNIVH